MAASDAMTRSRIIAQARRWVGKTYDATHADTAWRDVTDEPAVFDCSSFVCRVAIEVFGYDPERLARSASWLLDNLPEVQSPKPGDLVGYGRAATPDDGALGHQSVWHVMLYLGSGQVIGACDVAGKVTIRPLIYEFELGRRQWSLTTPPFRLLRLA